MPLIYGLASTRDNLVRYVGKSKHLASLRFSQHFRASDNKRNSVYQWIRLERWAGYDFHMFELQRCGENELDEMEAHWIIAARGHRLLNERKLGPKNLRYTLTEAQNRRFEDIRNTKWSFIENWEGWIGIRYYPSTQTWRAQLQTAVWPYSWTILVGDDPITHYVTYRGAFGRLKYGRWPFGDVNFAIEARNKQRERCDAHYRHTGRQPGLWPPDHRISALNQFCGSVLFNVSVEQQVREFVRNHTPRSQHAGRLIFVKSK